jgi:prevent-host-death family protein
MKTISAGDFKAHCLKLMDQVAKSHEALIVTKRGVPVVKMVPMEETQADPFGLMRESVKVRGDLSSYELSEIWEANEK